MKTSLYLTCSRTEAAGNPAPESKTYQLSAEEAGVTSLYVVRLYFPALPCEPEILISAGPDIVRWAADL